MLYMLPFHYNLLKVMSIDFVKGNPLILTTNAIQSAASVYCPY
jgi:hypothetical protein